MITGEAVSRCSHPHRLGVQPIDTLQADKVTGSTRFETVVASRLVADEKAEVAVAMMRRFMVSR